MNRLRIAVGRGAKGQGPDQSRWICWLTWA